MACSGTFNIAPYLTVRKRSTADTLVFTIGKISFETISTHILYPSVPPEVQLKAKDYGVGADVPVPAGRMSALYEWFAGLHSSAA